MMHTSSVYAFTLLFVLASHFVERIHADSVNASSNQTQEEHEVGIFYNIGQSFQASQLVSLIPGRIRSMASCVQRVGAGHDLTELQDEINYVIELLQENRAIGPVMLEMEMIFTDSTQALMAIPNIARKPVSEFGLSDLMLLRDAAFNLMLLPIRLERLRSSIMLSLGNSDLYDIRMMAEVRQHLESQLYIAARIGQSVLQCRASDPAAGGQESSQTTVSNQIEEGDATSEPAS